MRKELVNIQGIRAADDWAIEHGHPAAPLELLAAYGAFILRACECEPCPRCGAELEREVEVDAAMRVVRPPRETR